MISKEIEYIFKAIRNNYSTCKINKELARLPEQKRISRRRIERLMQNLGLVSNYTVAQFNQNEQLAVIVSDLTYVRVRKKWHYVCLFVDLFNREIIGYSAGENKTAELVYQALASIQANLNDVKMFHTDRGKEFDNQLISEALETFGIQQSLNMKGSPYNNAVSEATFKIFKTAFSNGAHFSSLEQLALELDDYIHLFNIRIHGTRGYLTPVEFKQQNL